MKARVSGVPYMVDLEDRCPVHEHIELFELAEKYGWIDDFGRWNFQGDEALQGFTDALVSQYEMDIATLEQENRQMRARMERLEQELKLIEMESRKFKDDLK
jgi:hypothetical protein